MNVKRLISMVIDDCGRNSLKVSNYLHNVTKNSPHLIIHTSTYTCRWKGKYSDGSVYSNVGNRAKW